MGSKNVLRLDSRIQVSVENGKPESQESFRAWDNELLRIVQAMVLESDIPAKAIASKLDKNYTTILDEANPENYRNKLGAALLLPLMQVCNSIAPLQYLASQLGYRIVNTNDVQPDKLTLAEECCDDLPPLTAFQQAILNGEPLHVVGEKLHRLTSELEQNFVAYRAELATKGKK